MLASGILTIFPKFTRILRNLSLGLVSDEVSLQQLRILFLVKEGLGITEMAHVLLISMPAVSKSVCSLEERGLIERGPGADRRSVKLKLSSQGRKRLNEVNKKVESKLHRGLNFLSAQERKDLEKGLNVLQKLMTLLKED